MNKKEFTKEDIKNGAVVELRNGERFLKVDYTLLDLKMNGEFLNIEHYKDNLTTVVKDFDIMKVLNPEQNIINTKSCNKALTAINNNNFKWTWERKENQKIKLKDLSYNQYIKWIKNNCSKLVCENCPFYKVDCRIDNTSWVNNKDLYSEKLLNQEIEL